MDKPTAAAGAAQKIEKQARQLAYDTRYKVKQSMKATSGSKLDPGAVRRAYAVQLSKSSAAPAVKARAKQMLLGEEYIVETKELATDNVANALYKVFVEGVQKEEDPIVLTYMEKLETAEHRKYKVKVTDKKTNNSYVRYATREKIAELRANPNIASVEMTGYGEPGEGEKKKGSSTAKAKAGKGLDPVGQEDKDIDNDGDHDKTDKYLLNRRKVRGAAISKRKVAEEFLGEVNTEKENPDANEKEIDVMKGSNTVKINPEVPGSGRNMSMRLQVAHHEMEGPFITEKALSQAQQKFMGMVLATKRGAAPMSSEVAKAAKGMTEKQARDFAKTKHKGLPKKKTQSEAVEPRGGGSSPTLPGAEKFVDELPKKLQQIFGGAKSKPTPKPTQPVKEETVTQADKKAKKEMQEKDPRSMPTEISLAKTAARFMGAKNPIVMTSCEEVEVIGEEEKKKSALDIVRASVEKQYGKGSIMTGKTKKPKATPAQKAAAQKASAAYQKRTSDYLHSSPRD